MEQMLQEELNLIEGKAKLLVLVKITVGIKQRSMPTEFLELVGE